MQNLINYIKGLSPTARFIAGGTAVVFGGFVFYKFFKGKPYDFGLGK